MATTSTESAASGIVAPQLPGGLDTPALLVDLDVVERNARRLGFEMDRRGIALRPHVKTHKSVALARIQLEAGARGVTVGNLGEAEVFADGGIDDIFIAYPIWAEGPKLDRLRALHERDGLRLAVGFDSAAGAERLAAAVAGTRRRLRVLLEVDPGNRRTGVEPVRAGEVGRAAAELGLELVGVFSHGGHAYAGPEAVGAAAIDEVRALSVGRAALSAEGIEVAILSAGSTPTALGAATAPVSELRAGTYLVGDAIQWTLGACPSDGIAISIAATVVSAAVPGQIVIDAGAKTLTKDSPPYVRGHGVLPAYPGAFVERVSDYHGVVRIPEDIAPPQVGEVVAIVPNHACPVIDLRDTFVATRDGKVVGTWPVDARGKVG